jgi:hypothetical protein
MVKTVTVVVTCTKDKCRPVAEDCLLRNVPGESVHDRIREWQTRTNRYWKESVVVRKLYAGDHWASVKSFASSHFEIDIWVCSAGYGLIHIDDHVVPYAATFSPTHPDSVAANLTADARASAPSVWWQATSSYWKTKFAQRPRSLSELIEQYPERSMLVVASENYMRAISDDLRCGIKHFSDPDQLTIVCSGARSLEGLDSNLLPSDARLQSIVGGARRSLNTRLAARILQEVRNPPKASSLRSRYAKLLNEQPPIEKYDRQPLSDSEVKEFIRKQLRSNPRLQHSPLLRILRDSNMACEQKRFGSLYREVVEGKNG